MDQRVIEGIVAWLPVVLGGLMAVYSVSVIRLILPVSSERAEPGGASGFYRAALAAGVLAVPAFGLSLRAEAGGWWAGSAWLWGVLTGVGIVLLLMRSGSRGPLSGIEAPPMLTVGGLLGGLALGLLAVALPWSIAPDRADALPLAAAAGLCFTLWLHRAARSGSPDGFIPHSRDAVGVSALLITAAILIGRQRYEGNQVGIGLPAAIVSIYLCLALPLPWLLLRTPRPVFALLLLSGIAGGVEAFASLRLFNNWLPAGCLILGHLTGLLILLTLLSYPSRTRNRALVAALLAFGAALAFRLLGAYGIALSGLGLLPLLIVISIPPRLRESFGPVTLRSLSAWTTLVFFRVLIEEMNLSRSVNLSDPYPFLGILAGALLPLLLASFAAPPSLGRIFGIGTAAVALPTLLGFFWKLEGSAGFLMGATLAQFMLLFMPEPGDSAAPDASTFSPEAASFLVGPLSLAALRLAPAAADLSSEATRAQKSWAMLAAALLAVAAYLIASLIARRCPSGDIA
ncbi:MAG: hypothetical protein IT210_00045 [Armatimonadetes bacterium]|nr:hypothetical protein [Armatimonadota bacterium]